MILCLFLCMTLLALDEETPAQNNPSTVIEQTVIQTIINQRTAVDKQPINLFGKKLNAYLNKLDSTTFKEFFPQLPLRAKLMYLLTITAEQYERFLNRYTNDEWTTFWLQSSPEEQKHLPKTRVEQLMLLRDAYYKHAEQNSSIFFSYFNPKAPYPNDLTTFKKRFYKEDYLATQADDFHVIEKNSKMIFLELLVFRKRYELFNL